MSVKLNLNLDKPNSAGETQIFHSICYKGIRFRINSGQVAAPKYWDKKQQRLKTNSPGASSINAVLQKQRSEIFNHCNKLLFDSKEIIKETVKPYLTFTSEKMKRDFSVLSLYDEFITVSKKTLKPATIKKYNTNKKHLQQFSIRKKYPLTFDAFNKDFLGLFQQYFYEDLNTYQSNFAKNVQALKSFLGWCAERGHNQYHFFRAFKIKEETNKPVVFLTIEEINKIASLELPEHLNKVRDIFFIECFCGLRFGDIKRLDSTHFKEKEISITSEKTNTTLRIPYNNRLNDIFEKYRNGKEIKLPVISNQKTNQYLKDICQLAEINTPTSYSQFRGNFKTEKVFEKWELVTTHTARHSFITNSIALGIDAETIKKIVGHKKHETFARYTQYNEEHVKKQMGKWDKI